MAQDEQKQTYYNEILKLECLKLAEGDKEAARRFYLFIKSDWTKPSEEEKAVKG